MNSNSLPWSAEAEQAVLGALMLDPDALLRIADRQLQATHFFDARHRTIWSAVAEMAARRLPVDVVTVFERLQSASKAEDCGGLAYLNALAQCVPSASNIGRYADAVIEHAMRRAIIAAADQAQDLARTPGDADDVLDRVAALFTAIKRTRATSSPQRLGVLFRARQEHWQALAEGETLPGIPTGLDGVNAALGGGLKTSKVTVIAARPSVGKTSLASQIGMNVAALGHPVLMLSQEMQAGELVDRSAANLGEVQLDRITAGRFADDDTRRLIEAGDLADSMPFYVDDQPALTLLDIRAKARQVQQEHGLTLLIVDYLQLCLSTGNIEKRHHQIEQISRGMKTLAKELDICVLLLSQLIRGRGDEPELDHLKESGAIEEDADSVILLHPVGQEADGSMTVLAKFAKNRQGRRGRIALALDGRTQRWRTSCADVSPDRR